MSGRCAASNLLTVIKPWNWIIYFPYHPFFQKKSHRFSYSLIISFSLFCHWDDLLIGIKRRVSALWLGTEPWPPHSPHWNHSSSPHSVNFLRPESCSHQNHWDRNVLLIWPLLDLFFLSVDDHSTGFCIFSFPLILTAVVCKQSLYLPSPSNQGLVPVPASAGKGINCHWEYEAPWWWGQGPEAPSPGEVISGGQPFSTLTITFMRRKSDFNSGSVLSMR